MPADDSPPRPGVWEGLETALLVANLVWTTLCLGGFLATTMVVSSALTFALLGVHWLSRIGTTPALPAPHPAGWILLPFLAYAAANVLWITPVRWLGWQDWYNWVQFVVAFWVVLNGMRSRRMVHVLLGTLALLGVVAVVLAAYQRFVRPDWMMLGRVQAHQFFGRASGPFGIPNSLAGFLLLLLPATAALAGRRRATAIERVFFGWLVLVYLLGLGLTISRGGWIALGLAVSAWPLLFAPWNWRRRLAVASGLLLFVVAVGASACVVSPNTRARFQSLIRDSGERSRPIIWRAAGKIFASHPVFGSGAGSFDVFFERYRPDREQTDPKWAHDDYLNTLSDYGVTGFLLWFGGWAVIGWRTAQAGSAAGALAPRPPRFSEDSLFRQGLAIGLLAFALQLAIEFHLKIPALGLASSVIAALLVRATWRPTSDSARQPGRTRMRPASCAVALAITAAAAWWTIPKFQAEAHRQAGRRELERLANLDESEKAVALGRAREQLIAATSVDPKNGQAWADLAYAIALYARENSSRTTDLGKEAEKAARSALGEGADVAEFWFRLGVALDMQDRWAEAGAAFSEGLRLSPRASQSWFYQAYHFALNPITHPLARAAVATCLRLDPGNREGDALRRFLAASP